MSPSRAHDQRQRGLQTASDDIRILGIHLKQSIKARFHKNPQGYTLYDEAAELTKFTKECTRHHGSTQHNQPRNEERLSETSSSSQLGKPAKVHFADEELQDALASSQPKPLPPTEQIEGLMRRWLDPEDEAEPGNTFMQVCPVTHSYIPDVIHGDGVNDWVTRAAALTEIDNARLPMLEASSTDESVMHDLQALQVLYCIVEGREVYGVPPWEMAERFHR